MDKIYKDALQITKEIVVKFVEVGRITPANFAENFPAIYAVVLETLNERDPRVRKDGGQGGGESPAPAEPSGRDAGGLLLAKTASTPSGGLPA